MKQLKKCVCMLFMLFVLSCGTTAILSCTTAPITAKAAAIKINKKKLTLAKGKIFQLKLIGTKKNPKWKSTNKAVASVSEKGKVMAIGSGEATITAKLGGRKYTCKVTVKSSGIVDAYESLIRKYGNKNGACFECYDFDSDGVLEILIVKTDYSKFGVFDYVNNNIAPMGSGIPYNTFYISRDGKYLISSNADIIQLYDLANGKVRPSREYVYTFDENSKEYKEWLYANALVDKAIWIPAKYYDSVDEAVNALYKMFNK